MAFGISNKGRVSPIAIDLGADTIKLLQVVPDETPQLVAAAAAVVPADARTDLSARLAFIEETIKGMLKNQPFRGRRAICAIPGFQTLIHNFMIARCDPEDVDALIDLELRERLGVDPSRMILRNFHAADHHRQGAARSDVVCLAAKREMVMQYLQVTGRCRLEVVGMHPEPMCVMRCFADLLEDPEESVCLVDIGGATTKVLIVRGEKLLLAKTIHAAGDHWNQRHAKHTQKEFLEARLMRLGGDDSASGGATAVADGPDDDGREDEVSDTLIDELRLVMRHHRGRHPEHPIQRLVLFGGEANQQNLCRRIAAALGVAGQLGDPLAGLYKAGAAEVTAGVDVEVTQPGWAVAMGLCLSEANL